jgi:hypothetical protein
LWDFSGYSSVTTEALPELGSRAEMRFYRDSSHFKDVVGDFVLDRLFGLSHPRRPVPLDFGVRLTPPPSNPRSRGCARLSSLTGAAIPKTWRGFGLWSTAARQIPAVLELWQSVSRAENLLETLQATECTRSRTLHHACR